ncbi:hypothetical protein ACFWNQ_35325 [Streptomyces virginiae]|uniref:hypothetical protein n=1 Tax=Streptomyces virginiae TaxID=1961 RepID=UPI003662473C
MIGKAVTVPPHGTSPGSRAVCPAGQTAVSGGWYTWTYNIGITVVQFGQGYTNTPGDSWVAAFENPSNVPGEAGAVAYCTP